MLPACCAEELAATVSFGGEAVDIWESVSFVSEHHWMALWPLIAVALTQDAPVRRCGFGRSHIRDEETRARPGASLAAPAAPGGDGRELVVLSRVEPSASFHSRTHSPKHQDWDRIDGPC